MGFLLDGAVNYLLQHFLSAFTTLMTTWMVDLEHMGIAEAHSAFVQATVHTMQGVALSLLTLNLAWTGIHQYILWSEGAPDLGSGVWKPTVLATLGIAASSAFTLGIFRFGMDLAGTVAGLTVYQQGLGTMDTLIHGLTLLSPTTSMILDAVYLITIAVLLLVVLLSAVRAAELAFYTAASPLFALGLVKRDMGFFKGFIQKLVILAVSQAVVIFAIKAGNAAIASMGDSASSVATAPLIYLGFLWVALRGPHMLEGMLYKSGGGEMLIIPMLRQGIGRAFPGGAGGSATASAPAGGDVSA